MAKYSAKSQAKVKTNMEEMKQGKLKSGRSNKKVTNPKQAIATGLSEARKAGAKVPPNPKTTKKAAPKKVAKKGATKKAATKKTAKKAGTKKTVKKTAKNLNNIL